MGAIRPREAVFLLAFLAGCGGGGGGGDSEGSRPPAASQAVVVFAWNTLGMHCLNSSYDSAVILPPYNNIQAQVVRRGNPPTIVTAGITVHYEIVNNTYSAPPPGSGKAAKGNYAHFWQNMTTIFGVSKPLNVGLTDNGLSGDMALAGDHFEVTGVPVVPIDDNLVWSPYQVAKITVKDLGGNVLAETRCTVPTSDEFRCEKCHGADQDPYLVVHDRRSGTSLASSPTPFLCADPTRECHVSPALGQNLSGNRTYLSGVIHAFHGSLAADQPACYDCHPGQNTQCNRSLRHTAADGNCTACHGNLLEVGQSVQQGRRVPWVEEHSTCATCHGGGSIPEVATGATLFRDAVGHQGMRCPACHGSPHAMYPAADSQDKAANYQPKQYLGANRNVVSIGSCGACHGSSKGAGLGEFGEAHGGTNPEALNACHVCHTAVSATPTQWPHQFKWTAR